MNTDASPISTAATVAEKVNLGPIERMMAEFGLKPTLTETVEFTRDELLEIGSKALQMTLVTRVDTAERRLWVSIRDKIVGAL